ncbi:MAG TPA: protealysin inhibitor emfourin [Vicinamibacteria bacterium]
MKISYRETGGFAGLSRGVELDLESLPPAEARKLQKLVEAACLESGTARGPTGARDLVGYEIVIEKDGVRSVVRFDDASVPESATELLEALQSRARPIPLSPR